MKSFALSLLAIAALAVPVTAGEIGFIEKFSLGSDRTAALKQLIPGTEDYYYYHCLHYQNTEQWEKVDATLAAWIKRYEHTPRVIEIENRQALLLYQQNPQRPLGLIRQRLGLQFNHQREQLNPRADLPTQLDPGLLARQRLTGLAFAQFPNTAEGFEDTALDWLLDLDLNADQRRNALGRLNRPDHPKLARLVVDDLNHANSGGFGQFEIYRHLLRSQLDEILKLKPDLRNQEKFVAAYLSKLRPSADANWRQNRMELQAYLDRLAAFISLLDPVHNSLKAHVLYHRLLLDRARGVYDPKAFLDYLKLPRGVGYASLAQRESEEQKRWPANLQADYAGMTQLPTIGNDEPLVRSYLQSFFLEADSTRAFEPYVNDEYLKQLFAETKIVNGLGEAERWASLLPPANYQALRERIDLEFAWTNKTEFAVDEPVALDLFVKNVETLIVKVFEVNTQNYHRQNLKEIGQDVNLDGLVANREQTYKYEEPPLRRVRRRFEFPALKSRGVYVIDFIGNGMSSRALIRKGRLEYLVRTGVAGQVFTILDEKHQPVPDAALWLAGTLYSADKSGTIVTPFTAKPGRQPVVLSAGDFSSLDGFEQKAEDYELDAGIYVDREALLSRRKARVVVRPGLSIGGTAVSVKVLKDVRLLVASVDLDNVPTATDVADFKLFDDRESIHEFQVPQRLASIRFVLRAKVRSQSRNEDVELTTDRTFGVNEIDRTERIEDLHFAKLGGEFAIDLFGKTGESQPNRPVQLSLKLRDFRQPVQTVLMTDARGRVKLGSLPGVSTVTATGPEGTAHAWPLRHDEYSYPQAVHGEVGKLVEVPYMGTAKTPDRSDLSLLELREGTFVADRLEALSIENGMLQVKGLAPGDYSLLLKDRGTSIRIRLTEGVRQKDFVLGEFRQLELQNPQPLQLEPIHVEGDKVRIRLRNATKLARVHLFATRFQPAFPAFPGLGSILIREPYVRTAPAAESLYVAGRNIGDEYRYIIDRKFARKYPGNMLERPGLLLNPWAIRSTETGQQDAQAGENFAPAAPPAPAKQEGGAGAVAAAAPQADFSNLDFLAETSVVLVNLVPKDGVIEFDRKDLGPHQELLVVAVAPESTASRLVSFPEIESPHFDLRLLKGLDPAKHYTQQKRISVLLAGDKLVVPDITSSRVEPYDTLGRVFSLYSALNPDPMLAEFGFLVNWPKLKPAEQRTQYSKFASHELNFFLYKKDPKFFREVVRPYLENKKAKTFLDEWLLDRDMTAYLQPWRFEQLNTFERILLGQRAPNERTSMARHILEQFELLPPSVDRFNQLFQTAIKGSALEITDRLGIQTAMPESAAAPVLRDGAPAAAAGRAMPKAPAEEFRKRGAVTKATERQESLKKSLSEKSKDQAADAKHAEDADRLDEVRQFYRKLDKTQEWAENNYYHRLNEDQNAALITVGAFWKDYAPQDPGLPFRSRNIADAARNVPEMLVALALLDLPFAAGEHKTAFKDLEMTLTAATPLVVYHEEILPATAVAKDTPILVSQNFFRHGDRYQQVNNEQVDKFVSEEFLIDVVYSGQVVVTNPTSSVRKLDALLQIPIGSLPVLNGQGTKSVALDLQPYHTQTIEYSFYFPAPGKFAHYPVQVSGNGEVLAFAAPFLFHVVAEPTRIDRQSWAFLSQHGSEEDVLTFLKQNNLLRLDLGRIAFRMQDREFFQTVTTLLTARRVYNHTLWSYGVLHNSPPAIREFLQHANEFVAQCGEDLRSPLLVIDPVLRKLYEHLEYRPLVNARVEQLGRQREILNDRFLAQYQRLLKILGYRRELDDNDLLAVTSYLLLQDRVEQAEELFGRVHAEKLETRLQYDYFAAYLNFSKSDPQAANEIAARYVNHPVERWREAFVNIANQAAEMGQQEVQVADQDDRSQVQTGLAATTAAFDFSIEGKTVRLNYQGLKKVRANYYLMDIELLFSRNPFVQEHSQQFSHIRPNRTQVIDLPGKPGPFAFTLPEELHASNVLVELVGAGQTQSHAYYANSLLVQVIENYGQVRVTHGKQAQPLAKVYVKAYARMRDGTVRFYKDGYTDLRGRFDYTSLNTNELENVEKFSLLVLSDAHGALVREANPPKQ